MSISEKLPPSSVSYLKSLFDTVFLPIRFGQSVSIITFSGAGKWANLSFLMDYSRELDENYPKTAYLFLDAVQLAFSFEEELEKSVSFMHERAIKQENKDLESLLSNVKLSSTADFLTLIRSINDLGQSVVLFIDNAEVLTKRDRRAQMAVSALIKLEQVHTSRMAFVFIVKGEISESLSNLGRLEKYFIQKVVRESEIPHNEECVISYLKRYEATRQVTFTEPARKHLKSIANGMPILSKQLIEKYHTDKSIANLLNNEDLNVKDIYEANAEYFDRYFEGLLAKLSPASKDYLFDISHSPTEYLRSAGLVTSAGLPINELFTFYLKNRGARYSVSIGLEALTAQELRVFHLLVDSLEKIVSREEIAKVLWPDNWQAKYSEQAIDRIVSNIRAKIRELPFKIVSAKGVGVFVEMIKQ